MIHHSAGEDGELLDTAAIRRFHTAPPPPDGTGRGWQDVGYHFLVERVRKAYEVIGGRPLYMDGAHCPGMNRSAIGVCLVGDFNKAAPPESQVLVAARFVAGLCFAFKIPPASGITTHRQHKATDCPGAHFDLRRFRELVEGYL